jgi:hypothetical protein
MTTREEYAEAAEWFDFNASASWERSKQFVGPSRKSFELLAAHQELASSVLRALADGAVLCEKVVPTFREPFYRPIEEQP